MGDIFQEIGEAFRDDFEAGVEAAFEGHVVYLDPESYDSDDPDRNMREFLEDLEEQIPNFDRNAFERALKDQTGNEHYDLEDVLELTQVNGPFAASIKYNGEVVQIVNRGTVVFDPSDPSRRINIDPESYDPDIIGPQEKHNLASIFSGIPAEALQNLNIDGDDLARFIGYHEGIHLNEPIRANNDDPIETLNREVRADHAAMKHMAERGDPELNQIIHDWRALRAHLDPTHATSALIDGDTPGIATQDHIDAALNARAIMIDAVATDLGMSIDDAENLLRDNPERFISTMERLMEEHAEDAEANPIVSGYINDIIGAYRRQIIPHNLTVDFNEAAQQDQQEAMLERGEPERRRQHGPHHRLFGTDPEVLERATKDTGAPEVAGNADLAALAAEQAGADPELVAAMRPDTVPGLGSTPIVSNAGPLLETAAP